MEITKSILVILFVSCFHLAIGQQITWVRPGDYESKHRLDTIYGRIMYDDLITNFPTILGGMRIDSIESIYGQVACPDEQAGTYFGCAVLHYGWRDKRGGYRYVFTEHKEAIQNKQVIHFTPK